MSTSAFVLIYAFMLVFDLAVFAGAAYLVVAHQWSAWWMLVAAVVCGGSSPGKLIILAQGGGE